MATRTFNISSRLGTLRSRVTVTLVIVALLVVVAGAAYFYQLVSLTDAVNQLREEMASVSVAWGVETTIAELIEDAQQGNIDDPTALIRDIEGQVVALEGTRDELEAGASRIALRNESDVELRQQMTRVVNELEQLIDLGYQVIQAAEERDREQFQFSVALLGAGREEVLADVTSLNDLIRQRQLDGAARIGAASGWLLSISAVVLVGTVLGGVGVVLVSRDLVRKLAQLTVTAGRLAEGDFDERVTVTGEDEFGQLAQAFNAMAEELRDLYAGLGRQVGERTRDLERRKAQMEASAQVAREAAAIRDVSQLLERTVQLISNRFGFYHAGIFLVEESGHYAVLRAASSEGGQRMLARGHRLRVGEVGIVGYVTGSGEARVSLDVGDDASYFDNPDLPYTHSEIALPLMVRGQVIGALDVQSVEERAFSGEDVSILQTLADQLALAIDNARLLEESQRTVQELEELYGQRIRAAWEEHIARQTMAYLYTGVGVEAVPLYGAMEMGVSMPDDSPLMVEDVEGRRLIAPIRLRDQVIGSILLRQVPDEKPWTQEEITLLQEVSGQVALALENARLIEDTQLRAERERMVAGITARMRETLDMETLLRTSAQEIRQVLGLPEVTVRLAVSPDLEREDGS